MLSTKVQYIFILSILLVRCFDIHAQQQYQSDSLIDVNDELSLHKRISVALSAGKRTDDLSLKLGLQFMTYVNWKKVDLGLGVNYEDEDYFNLIPAYAHIAYNPIPNENHVKVFIQSGLAFNVPGSVDYDYGKPGILLGGGIEQEFILFKRLSSMFQIMYRFQQTSTVREWPANQQGQDDMNSEIIKHSMHRVMFVFGFNF
jgi:hypothetical protein